MERQFELLPGVLQVLLEQGEDPEDIVPVLSEAARLARAKKLKSLLVISGSAIPRPRRRSRWRSSRYMRKGRRR